VKKIGFLFLISCLLFSPSAYLDVLERVVAIVDDDVILLSELNDAVQSAVNSGAKKITKEEVLSGMINRILLLREAKKFRPEEKDDNTLINEYIENNLRAFIRIPLEEVEIFYKNNREIFRNKEFYDVRYEIETYLIEKELNRKLLEHIKELREKSYIRVQL